MNYQKHHDLLIARAKSRGRPDGYFERHHIKPRCMGGTNEPSNLVRLTPEEHYLAHLLLVKLHPGKHKLVVAVMAMSGRSSPFLRRSNKLYGWLRRRHSEWMKARKVSPESIEKGAAKLRGRRRDPVLVAASAKFHTGRIRPPETGKKISESHKKRCRTSEFRAKMSALKIGFKHSDSARKRMSAAQTGRVHSDETKARMSAASKGRPKSPETRQRMSEARRLVVAAKQLALQEIKNRNNHSIPASSPGKKAMISREIPGTQKSESTNA